MSVSTIFIHALCHVEDQSVSGGISKLPWNTAHEFYPQPFLSFHIWTVPFSVCIPTQNVVPRIKKEEEGEEKRETVRVICGLNMPKLLSLEAELLGPKLWKQKPGLASLNTNMLPACVDGLCYCHSPAPSITMSNGNTVAAENHSFFGKRWRRPLKKPRQTKGPLFFPPADKERSFGWCRLSWTKYRFLSTRCILNKILIKGKSLRVSSSHT